MMKLKFNTKIYLIAGITAIISSILLCFIITTIVIGAHSPTNPPVTPPSSEEPGNEEPTLPTLDVPSNITIEILATKTFTYSVENLNNYVVSISILDNTIATIDETTIIPHKVGTTKIITSINTEPLITKETTLTIVDCTKEVTFYITDINYTTVDIFYTDTDYILEINQNILPVELPTITYSNISKFELLKTENTSYFYKFKIESYGDFTFNYKGTYVEKSYNYFAYKLPTNFEIIFNREINNNTIYLYLFNNNYIDIANTDGYFNNITYTILPQDNTLDNITISEYDTPLISISNNTITALGVGTATIKFYSSISNTYKTYSIVISEINISTIVINNENKNFGTMETIYIDATSNYHFAYSYLPVYGMGELVLNYSDSELNFSDNYFTFINNAYTSTITITYNNQIIYTLNLCVNPVIKHNITITYSTLESNIVNSTIYTTYANDALIQLSVMAVDSSTNTPISTQDYEVNIHDTNICSCNDRIINGNINLLLHSTGTTTIDIIDIINNITITLTIIVE